MRCHDRSGQIAIKWLLAALSSAFFSMFLTPGHCQAVLPGDHGAGVPYAILLNESNTACGESGPCANNKFDIKWGETLAGVDQIDNNKTLTNLVTTTEGVHSYTIVGNHKICVKCAGVDGWHYLKTVHIVN